MSADPAVLLDVSRLISRLGMGPATGIDRVEAEWLAHLEGSGRPYLLLARVRRGQLLLPREAGAVILDWLAGRLDQLPAPDLIDRVRRRQDPRARAEGVLRRLALHNAASTGRGIARLAGKMLGPGAVYLNTGHSNLSAKLLAGLAPLRRMVLIHDTIPLDYPEFTRGGQSVKFRDRLAAVLEHADLVLAVSQATRADLLRWRDALGLPDRAGTAVAPIGTRLAPPGPIPDGIEPGRPFFVTLGTIEPRKNHALLLDAWNLLEAQLPAGDIPQLLVVGRRGWENRETFSRLDRCPPGGPVRELSGLDDSAVAGLVSACHALLMPSRAEGFGLPYTEAAARGVPVVCTLGVPAAQELLGDYACYLPADRADLWAAEILRQSRLPPARLAPLPVPQWNTHFTLVEGLMREGLHSGTATAMPR